ncbi:MAG: ATP-binding protein [Bacteroidales bacterium]|jgi:predicted ATPase|nr:ATP-binding protein [Bacteroidales bacterium]
MKIVITDRFGKPSPNDKDVIYLTWDGWNDFNFYTLFGMFYVDESSQNYEIGTVKIGFFGQEEGPKDLKIGGRFDRLDDKYFSLGQSDLYYSNLNELGEEVRDNILSALNDIAKNEELYERAIEEKVTYTSLLRNISASTVKNQYRRIANGGVRLTEYDFHFVAPSMREGASSFDLRFRVKPESFPPTNIHILIGRNGVGKTHLMNNMIDTLLEDEVEGKGEFILDDNESVVSNLIYVSFSAFDNTKPREEKVYNELRYSYVGLKQGRIDAGNIIIETKNLDTLIDEFYKSLNFCRTFQKPRWETSIEMLESDPNFKEAEIKSLVDIENKEEFENRTKDIFKRLSSGHKIVLLTTTRLIQVLQEKSLVLIDEPEAHLHPPLLSAFVRALSELLISTNGVAIIATHSPVILQEVPKCCVWKLSRSGAEAKSERLPIETFGENVGILTNEVFGLEVMNSGFYKLLDKVAQEKETYGDVIEHFNGQLGMEAKAILMTYFTKQ